MRTCYLDSSVLLRFLFHDEGFFDFSKVGILVSSELLRVECFRALDRVHKLRQRDSEQILLARTSFFQILSKINFVGMEKSVLEFASQSFDMPIKTLDAIHLSTALIYAKELETPIVMLTHDLQLGRAARSQNLEVMGCTV